MNLVDQINYQEGSVVSREMIKKDGGTLTLFAFDKDQGLSKHSAPFDAFIYVLEGEAEITIDDQMNDVKAGETLIMPANHPPCP